MKKDSRPFSQMNLRESALEELPPGMAGQVRAVYRRLAVDDSRFIEIEAKRRVLPEDLDRLRRFLGKSKGVRHRGEVEFFDQFLDTSNRLLFHAGASLRLRYKGGGSRVYLQYKGPGFHSHGVLFRSEFSSGRLPGVLREESLHDIVRFDRSSVRDIFLSLPPEMARAMKRHLGQDVLRRSFHSAVITLYRKDKFIVDLGPAFLEPSVDCVQAFHLQRSGINPLSMFCEYENEIKSRDQSLLAKLFRINELRAFDERLAERFHLPPERLDKYQRCSSFFPIAKSGA